MAVSATTRRIGMFIFSTPFWSSSLAYSLIYSLFQVQYRRAYRIRYVGEDVPPIYIQARGAHGALPQEKQHRDGLLNDKGEVRQRPTLQERYRPDQRSVV